MFLYPWGDFHSLNLGWFLLQFKDWVEKIQEYLDNGGGTSENLANVIAPVFNAANYYSAGDYVLYNSELYKANQAVNPGTWDPDAWTQCLIVDEMGSGGAGVDNVARLMIAGQYSASFAYQKYGICRYNDKLWMANIDLPAGGEAWNAAHWDEITVGAGLSGLRRSVDTLSQAISNESTARQNADEALKTETWKGKHLLIIGDSWSMGWTGSEYVTNKYPEVICTLLGCTADICRQGSGGFTAVGSSSATYPGETFVDVLDHYQNNKYDAILVQAGWNDIHNDNATDGVLSNAIYNFMQKIRTNFNNVTVFCIPSYPAYLMPLARFERAKTLVNQAQYQGMVTSLTSLNWLMHGRNTFRGDDAPHPNQTGYSFFARMAASFLAGTKDAEWIQDQMTYQREAGTVVTNTTPFDATFPDDTAFNNNTAYVYIKLRGNTVALNLRTRVITTDTSGNKIFIEGLPAPALDYQYLTVNFRDAADAASKSLPRAYVDYNTGSVQVVLTGDCSNAVIEIRGVYKTKQNMYA